MVPEQSVMLILPVGRHLCAMATLVVAVLAVWNVILELSLASCWPTEKWGRISASGPSYVCQPPDRLALSSCPQR
jgi:hypothetical protein